VNHTLTSIPGFRVGHAVTPAGDSGCTVILGPFRGAVEIRGLATGSRELGVLDPHHLVPQAHAVLLTGGSAFGLAAADGAMAWLEDHGMGFPTGAANVPIVPAAVIYDLAQGRERPGRDLGRTACEVATDAPVPEGAVGVGAGATVGKWAGPDAASPGGLGSWALDVGPWRVGALVVTNALGDVVDADGTTLAGARGPDGAFLDARDALPGVEGSTPLQDPGAGKNTTLAVVATDAPLSDVDLGRLARTAANALSTRIFPVHTPFDGDVVFALSSSGAVEAVEPAMLVRLGAAAQLALEAAIVRSVTESA